MPQPSTPRGYALSHLQHLEALWSGVHDADVEAVHDARVTTRRVRAVLPFIFTAPPAAGDEMRRIGRALGRVRELDATQALLTELEGRVPDAATAIALVRADLNRQLARNRKRLIKSLRHRPRSIAHAIDGGIHLPHLSSLWRSWRHELRDAIRQRAMKVHAALDQATAVYMPNRAHAARIAVKKLRYVVELALATGVIAEEQVLGDLKRLQEALGRLRDMTVLAEAIDRIDFPAEATTQSRALTAVVGAEIVRLHDKYARRRGELRAACDGCLDAIGRNSVSAMAIPAVAAVAIPVLAAWYLRPSEEKPPAARIAG